MIFSFGVNSALPALKQKLAIEESWGVRPVEFVGLDSKQGLIVQERLYGDLTTCVWKSDSPKITKDDLDVADPICVMITKFLRQKCVPVNFNRKHLMFDADGCLKCLKVTLRGDFEYFLPLVDFATDCASGNPYIYKYLVTNSRLSKHKFANYFLQIMDYTCRGEDHSPANVAAAMDIYNAFPIVQRGRELLREFAEVRLSCCQQLELRLGSENAPELAKVVGLTILETYKEFGCIGKLPEFLEERVVGKLIKELT